jgi:hypothetical protein
VATLEDSRTASGDVLDEAGIATIALKVGLDLLTLKRAIELRLRIDLLSIVGKHTHDIATSSTHLLRVNGIYKRITTTGNKALGIGTTKDDIKVINTRTNDFHDDNGLR